MTKVYAFFIFLLYFPNVELTAASCPPNGDCDLSSCPAFVNVLSRNMDSNAFIHQSSHFQSYSNNKQDSMYVGGRDDSLAIWHCNGTSWTWVMGRKKNKGKCKGGIHSTEDTRCPTEVKVWKFYNGTSWLEIVDSGILKVEELANSTCNVEGSNCILPLHYEVEKGHWLNMTACRRNGSNHESYCISEIPWKFDIQERVCNEQCFDQNSPIEFNNLPKSDLCQAVPEVQNNQCKTEEKSCKFPFIYQDKTYTGCTDEQANFHWCATDVYQNKTIKMWGRCSQASCPRDDCLSPNFKCSDGKCISPDKLCNKIEDCQNGEDETGENCGCLDLPHPVILLLGETGVGKSTLGNFLLGNNPFVDKTLFSVGFDGVSLESKTIEISWQFGKWMGDPTGKDITIIDTPGAGDTEGRDYDNGIALVKLMKKICSIDVFLYIIKGSETRMTDEQIAQMKLYQSLFSEGMWKHTMMETTFWGHTRKEAKDRKNTRKTNEITRAKKYNEKLQIEFENSNLNISTVFIDPMLEIFKGRDQEAEEYEDEYEEYEDEDDSKSKNKCDKRQERRHKRYTDQLWKFATSKDPFECEGRCSNPDGYFAGEPKVSPRDASKYVGEAVQIRCEVWSGYNRNAKNVSIWFNTTALAVVNGSQVRDINGGFGDKLKISASQDINGFYTQISLNIPHFMQNLEGLYQCKNGFEHDESSVVKLQMKTDYILSQWSIWSPCTKTCASDDDSMLGTTSRNRILTPSTNGGKQCPSNAKTNDTRLCANMDGGTTISFCPVDARWDAWTKWSTCQHSCDDGSLKITRRRRCLEARNFGLETICIGGRVEIQKQDCHQSDNKNHICQTGSQRNYTDDVAKQELSDSFLTCPNSIIQWPVIDLNDVLEKLIDKCGQTSQLDISIEADIIYVTRNDEFIGIKTLTTHSNEIIFQEQVTNIYFKQVDAPHPTKSKADNIIGGYGINGNEGQAGTNGANGAIVNFVSKSVYASSKSVQLRTYGGRGGRGQNGGEGADGWSRTEKKRNILCKWGYDWVPKGRYQANFRGTVDENLDQGYSSLRWTELNGCDGWDYDRHYGCSRSCLDGANGRKGGDGGRGGDGGKGGNSGYVQIMTESTTGVFSELKVAADGELGGKGGSGGSGGKGQQPAKSIVYASNHNEGYKSNGLARTFSWAGQDTEYHCRYNAIVGRWGNNGRAGKDGDYGTNGYPGKDDEMTEKQVEFSQATLNTFVRTQAMRSISTKCSGDAAQDCHWILGLHGYSFPRYFTSSTSLDRIENEITTKLNNLGSIVENYNLKGTILKSTVNLAQKVTETSKNEEIVMLNKRKENHDTNSLLFRNEMTTIETTMDDLITKAINSKGTTLDKKLAKERTQMVINIITSSVIIVGRIADVGFAATSAVAAEGAKLVQRIATMPSALKLVKIPSNLDEVKITTKSLGNTIGCDSNTIIEAIDQIEKFKETDSSQTRREIVSYYRSYLASAARREMKESLHCVLTTNIWYQFQDDPDATKLENAIESYFETSQKLASNLENILFLEMDINLLEVELKQNSELSKKLKAKKSTAMSAELMQEIVYYFEKEILEDMFSWTNGLNYIFLHKFDIWTSLNDVFNTPLNVWQNTQNDNLSNLKNLNKKVKDWKKECEDKIIKFNWKQDGYVHYRFANKAALGNLKNPTLRQTSISIPVPNKPLLEDITAEQGLAISNINTRLKALYINLEFDPAIQRPSMPTDITLKITHDGHSTFKNGTDYLQFSTPSLTEDITNTVLPQLPEKEYVIANMSANAFDCSENNPDWMIEKVCPGLYADYLITVPIEVGLNCPDLKKGTNCQDLDLSSLVAIHFYGKVMYL